MLRRTSLALLLSLAVSAGPTLSGTPPADCIPPAAPEPVTNSRLIAEFRDEIGEEYSTYFDRAQLYLLCMDTARNAVAADLRAAIEAYQRLDASGRR